MFVSSFNFLKSLSLFLVEPIFSMVGKLNLRRTTRRSARSTTAAQGADGGVAASIMDVSIPAEVLMISPSEEPTEAALVTTAATTVTASSSSSSNMSYGCRVRLNLGVRLNAMEVRLAETWKGNLKKAKRAAAEEMRQLNAKFERLQSRQKLAKVKRLKWQSKIREEINEEKERVEKAFQYNAREINRLREEFKGARDELKRTRWLVSTMLWEEGVNIPSFISD